MVERFLSQRQFANLASISPATLQKLIAAKEIRVREDGLISSLEYENILINDLKSTKADNILVIDIISNDSQIDSAFARANTFATDGRICCDSLATVFEATKVKNTKEAENQIRGSYNNFIYKEFCHRYTSMINTAKLSALSRRKIEKDDTLSFYDIPYFITDELFTYGRVLSGNIEDYDKYLSSIKNLNQSTQLSLDNKFNVIMKDLNIYDGKDFLFTRANLTPEFFERKGVLYDKYFRDDSNNRQASILIPVIADKYTLITEKYINKAKRVRFKSDNFNGFVFSAFFNLNNLNTSWNIISQLLFSGLFANVILIGDEETFNSFLPDYISQTINTARLSSKFTLEYKTVAIVDEVVSSTKLLAKNELKKMFSDEFVESQFRG